MPGDRNNVLRTNSKGTSMHLARYVTYGPRDIFRNDPAMAAPPAGAAAAGVAPAGTTEGARAVRDRQP